MIAELRAARRLLWCGAVPSMIHEAPLAVLRRAPALVPTLLRESLGFELPAYASVELGDPGFTQVVSAERRADLVVELRGGPPDHAPVLGVIVEVQRARDDAKRRSWPTYVSALHERLGCQTALIVIATDDATARWAATPITTLLLGSVFTPLVLGPDRIPRLSTERALHEPWLAVLSAIVHGNRADGLATSLAAIAAAETMSEERANFCYDLVSAVLDQAARRSLEEAMQFKWNRDSYFARGIREEGLEEGLEKGERRKARNLALAVAERHGAVTAELRERVMACDDTARLDALVLALCNATDRAGAELLLAQLPTPAPIAATAAAAGTAAAASTSEA